MGDVVSEREARLNPQAAGDGGALHGPLPDATPDSERPVGRSSAVVILLLWTAQFLFFSLDRLARDAAVEGWRTFAARLVVTAFGILLSFAVLAALRRTADSSFLKRAALALALALAAAAIHGVVNLLVFAAVLGPFPGGAPTLGEAWSYLPTVIYFFSWIHLAVAVILLSLAYGEDLVHRDRRLAELAHEADRARRTASRYRLELEQRAGTAGDEPHLWVRRGGERVRLDLARVDRLAAEGECVRIHCGDQSFLERMSLGAAAEKLAPYGFIRVHRSMVVNSDWIESLRRTQWGSLQLRLRSGAELRVSRSFESSVRDLVQRRG